MDLITGYDFNLEEDRQRAWAAIDRDKPELVVGSPECNMFSNLQHLNKWTVPRQEQWEKAKKHLEFICEVYQYQIDQGRWLLHEHPSTATSWREMCAEDIDN